MNEVPKAPQPLNPEEKLPEGMDRILKEYGATLSQLNTLKVVCEQVLTDMADISKGALKRTHMAVPKTTLAMLVEITVEADNLIRLHLTPENTDA
jgi:hypothetical protein